MFRVLLIIIFCFVSVLLFGQQSINSLGGNIKNSSGEINYSIGQTIDHIGATTGPSTYNSIQIANEVLTLSTDLFTKKELEISIGPNPFFDHINLNFSDLVDLTNLNFSLFDLEGKQLKSGKISNYSFRINFKNLVPATYILIIQDNFQTSNTYKIVKY